ncbi:chemotaxis protein CheA [Alkalibacter mobilis]|uniref:chemotaxis protein CheA n=1 Tax=Alkalibacter mobilis TaxID=2787712 RepID=UPI00189C98F6|nr:chemotaxis protein CheA [Alkalibacter mobilis]MBF7096343.1 chemotaxis protein CheA [Alkalibacter mobilis]
MDDIQKYRDLFFEETDEYLQSLNDNLLQLEKDTDSPGIIDEIFRSAHTLKGMAATMGYTTMAELTHSMENVLELFRSGKVKVTSNTVTVIFKCLDKLSEIVEDLRSEHYPDYDIKSLLYELDALADPKMAAKDEVDSKPALGKSDEISDMDADIIRSALEKGYNAFSIAVKVVENCMLKGARAYLVVNKLEAQGDILQTNPGVEDLEEGNFDRVFKMIFLTKETKENVREMIENVSEVEEVSIDEITEEALPDHYIMTEDAEVAEDGNNANKNSKEILDQKKNQNLRSEEKATTIPTATQSIRVDLSRLDNFMNLVSELVIYRTRLEELSSKQKSTEIDEPLEQVARITSDLQDLVLKIRMQPVNVVFNRFPRMIRDLSQELNKEIDLIIKGEETELDRTVVSELGEPLVHLMRNAADHGIESIAERVAKGKEPKGTIRLEAYQEGNKVVIKVSDDGKGLNPETIRESAVKKGIPAEDLDKNELIQLIFNQGFSTNQEVTNISGRGVGMDVVRQKISSLGGSIEVMSEVDKGTQFVIKLPLTLSIIQALMVHVGTETFALPLGIIEKVVNAKPGDIKESHNEEVYVYREKVIPVVRVNEKLGIESREENQHIILVMIGGKHYGLLVDDLIGQQEIVIKKLSGSLGNMKEYLGATILGNGDITLILDVGNLCSGKGENFE